MQPTCPPPHLRTRLHEVRTLIWPCRWWLLAGMLLICISRLAGLAPAVATKVVVDNILGQRRVDLLIPVVIGLLAAGVLDALASFAVHRILGRAAQELITELRCGVQARLIRLPLRYFDVRKSGALVARVMNDPEGIRNLVGGGMLECAGSLVMAAVVIVLLVGISPMLTGLVLLAGAATAVLLNRAFGVMRPIFVERSRMYAELSGRVAESFGGIRVVKGYQAEVRESAVFARCAAQLRDNGLRSATATAVMNAFAALLGGAICALVLYASVRQVVSGAMTLGEMITFTVLVAFLVAPAVKLMNAGPQLSEALAGIERTREVLHQPVEDDDPRRLATMPPIRGEVVFENVSFAYEAGVPVLHGVSFSAQPGSVTALVGPSGSGKSTIIGLLAAFYSPSHGAVRVDGVDLSTVRLPSYRLQLGLVLQDTFLFDGSIEENVAFSRPGASQADVREACRMACVDQFAQKLKDGYQTLVGERGVKLSGGERQRVSIARAILADPRILILDEATSNLDSESEVLIQQGLSRLREGRTTFVIAHRLSTIRQAGSILFIEAGRLIAQGTHAELLQRCPRYCDLYLRQHDFENELLSAPKGSPEAAAASFARTHGLPTLHTIGFTGR
jgi:ABC-type multidrug transport system fused ATPase/permease subunit